MFKLAHESNIPIVMVSKCWRGGTSSEIYAVGLDDPFVIDLKDATVHAAYAKAATVLSRPAHKGMEKFREQMLKVMRGEFHDDETGREAAALFHNQ